MSPSHRSLRAALALVLAASLPQCASAPSPAPVVAPAVTAPSSVELAVGLSFAWTASMVQYSVEPFTNDAPGWLFVVVPVVM